jgi:hypothetical protein
MIFKGMPMPRLPVSVSFVTANELRFSEENSSRYYLFRLFRFRADPKLFALQDQLGENCILEASQYVARPK